jgi:hypothetical protein
MLDAVCLGQHHWKGLPMIEGDILDRTANELLDYLASDGYGGEWFYLGDLADWGSLYNPTGQANFLSKCVRDLVGRGFAETRRLSAGRQMRLTAAGESFAMERSKAADEAWATVDIGRLTTII